MPNSKPKTSNLKSFKKGESGNPKGRPKGQSLTSILQDAVDRKISKTDPLSGLKKKVTISKALAYSVISKGLKGDIKAINMIFDRLEGKPKQSIEMDGDLNTNTNRTNIDLTFEQAYELKYGHKPT